MFFIIINLFISLGSYSAENVRLFKSPDSKAEIVILESKETNYTKYYFKLTNTSESENNKVIIFKRMDDNSFKPVNEATDLVLLDYDKRIMVKGTSKKAWTLAGLNKNLLFYETHEVSDLTKKNIIDDYNLSEGISSTSLKSSIESAQVLLKDKCKSKLKINASELNTIPHYKIVSAVNGITDLCDDADYLKAVQDLKEIKVMDSSNFETPFLKVKNGVLTVDFGKNSENTSLNIKQMATKVL